MVRTPESPIAPRLSPPDLPDDVAPAQPRRSADLIAAALDLTGATILDELTRIRFTDSASDEVGTRGMRASDVDLRGLDALSFLDANSLRGTTLTSLQVQQLAALIAAGLGIQIKD